jgi:hypothetical protein
VNPFEIPGAVDSHDAPLRPWVHPEHVDYYVNVDGYEKAYASFQRVFHAPGALREVGGFVLVTGTGGCGKTSLINRCAHWLHTELETAGLEPRIVDPSTRVPTNIEIDERMTLTYDCVLWDQNESFSQPDLSDLKEYRNDLLRGYARMSDVLLPGRVLVVLLPVTELAEEILKYAPLVQPRLVFFAESSAPTVAAVADSLGTPPGVRKASLSLGSLRAGDGQRFSRKRAGDDGARCTPPLQVDAAERLFRGRDEVGNSLTIGQLQRYLYGVYKEIGEMPVPPNARVNYNKIIRHIVNQVRL